jgi:hypothetical protein
MNIESLSLILRKEKVYFLWIKKKEKEKILGVGPFMVKKGTFSK